MSSNLGLLKIKQSCSLKPEGISSELGREGMRLIGTLKLPQYPIIINYLSYSSQTKNNPPIIADRRGHLSVYHGATCSSPKKTECVSMSKRGPLAGEPQYQNSAHTAQEHLHLALSFV